jgi:ATP-dependent exoDNAse (exonuclease V) beta subunit
MTMAVPLPDLSARERIANSLDETLIVEAAAGTGKTTELVTRIVRVLSAGRAPVTGIVAVTFTEKAAGELKLRLREALEVARRQAADDAPRRCRLEAALANLEEAHISTIHGFCAELLRERPVEAGVDPLFSVFTETQARRCYNEAFAGWFQEVLEDPPEGVRRSLRRTSRSGAGGDPDDDGPVDRLRNAGWDLTEWRDFPAAWTRPPFARERAIAHAVDEVHAFASLSGRAGNGRDVLYLDTAAARRASDELRLLMGRSRVGHHGTQEGRGAEGMDCDAAESVLVDLRRHRDFRRARKGSGASFGSGVTRADMQAAHQRLVQLLDSFAADADADLAALLRDELRGSIERYQQRKVHLGALDFLDLLLRTRDLIRDRDEVRREFQARFACIFVDEFQDTDPLQAEILLLLSADDGEERDWRRVCPVPGKLFIVGDPKQSIYRFRRADVGMYGMVCGQLERHGVSRLSLTTSFRSTPNIQNAVNAAFAPLMRADPNTLQADYVELSPSRPPSGEQPSIIALPVPEPYGKRYVSGQAIERSLPDAVGAFVHWLVTESGWRVTERRSGETPVDVEPRHICLLFRRFVSFGRDMTRPYVDALEARGIKHLLVGGRAFHDREEIETLRAALAAIEWPDDELSVFAALRGTLFAIGDEELFEYRHQPGIRSFHPFRVPDSLPMHLAPIGEALRLLAALHRGRNRRPVADTITRLLDATRAHVGFALRRAGEQVLANALHVAELARQYELADGLSFRGFVEELRDAAKHSEAADAPIVEEGSDGVRLMTVHKAKGLEFPVVILADITGKLAPLEASRHLDSARGLCALRIGGWSPRDLILQQPLEHTREEQEGVRVAYVAATRARDLLVVPAVGDQPYDDGWIGPLDRAIYPPVSKRRTPAPAARCPIFKKDSVLWRADGEVATGETVCPGLHRFDGARPEAGFEVVWWDPSALQLGAEPPFGLRRQELISKDVASDVVAERVQRYFDWRKRRDEAIASGSMASVQVRTATEWALGDTTAVGAVAVVTLARRMERPGGARYGTLVHASLAAVPLDADEQMVHRVVETQGRIVAAAADEIASAIDVVRTALAHPLIGAARAAGASSCFRETPVTWRMDSGEIVEGNVDLAYVAGDDVVVVDFKTDRELAGALDRYSRQLQVYAAALSSALGRRPRPVLMQI